MGPTGVMTIGAVAAGLASLLATVWRLGAIRRASGVVRLVDLLAPAGVGGAVLVATHVIVVARGVSSSWFALVHLAYLGAVVGLPILGGGLLLRALGPRSAPRHLVLATLLVVPAPIGWYATHWAPYALRVDRATSALPAARAGSQPLRVGVIADLQTNRAGDHERRAITMLLAQRPDLILIAGDVFQGDDAQFERSLPGLRAQLDRLEAPGGVFAVRGDVDTGDRLDRLVAGLGIEVLDDEVAHVRVGDRRVAIGGNRLLWAPPPAVAMRAELLASDPAEVRILLSHRPDVVLLLPPRSGVDLVVAGHTHGGQVALPLLGPIETYSAVSRSVGGGGLHEVDGNPIYVSTGVGLVREQAPQVRFLTRPSVGLVTLR